MKMISLGGALVMMSLWGGVWVFWRWPENFVLGIFLLMPVIAGIGLYAFARWHRAAANSGGYARVVAGNLLVFVCLLSALLPALEIYYRFYCDETDSVAVTKVSKRWIKRHFRQNAAGFPDSPEYLDAREKIPRRIVLLGNSFAAGYGVKEETNRLAALIRKQHPEWGVQLLARPGADTRLHLQFLDHYFAKGRQANDVVLIYGLNDIQDLLVERGAAPQSVITPPSWDWPWLRQNSYLFDSFFHKALVAGNANLKMQNYSRFVFAGYEGEIWQLQQARLSRLRELAESHGAKFRVVTFPLVHAVGLNYEFRPIHERLDAFWRQEGVPHLDLLQVFEGIPPARLVVNKVDAHPNAFAHKLAAREVAAFLERDR